MMTPMVYAAIVVGLLLPGYSPPAGIAFVIDPATNRQMTVAVVAGMMSLSDCRNWVLPDLARSVESKNFEVKSQECREAQNGLVR